MHVGICVVVYPLVGICGWVCVHTCMSVQRPEAKLLYHSSAAIHLVFRGISSWDLELTD